MAIQTLSIAVQRERRGNAVVKLEVVATDIPIYAVPNWIISRTLHRHRSWSTLGHNARPPRNSSSKAVSRRHQQWIVWSSTFNPP